MARKILVARRTLTLPLALLLFFQYSFCQEKSTSSVQQVWGVYLNQTRFSANWGLWLDLQLRTKENFFEDFSQGIARAGLTYYVNDDVKLTLGYAYVHHFPATGHANISLPESRPWQQIQWHNNSKKIKMMQWFRLEQRFRRKMLNDDERGEGYNFNHRLRYNFFLLTPLSKKRYQPGTVSFIVNNEVHINFGKEIVYNYFDQNRFFVGANIHVNDHASFQLGYMNLFQQLPAGNKYRSIHVPRVTYVHNMDLRKK